MLVDYKQKCLELQQRLAEVEELNEVATLALTRTKAAIRRLRLEHVILLERIEERALAVPEGLNLFEEMACPPNPVVMDELLAAAGMARHGVVRRVLKKKGGAGTTAASAAAAGARAKLRDPDQPKRPTNAYIIFFDMEKDRIRKEHEALGTTGDLSKTLTEVWRNMSEEEKKPYFKLYEDDRLRYQREMAEYNERKGDDHPAKKRKIKDEHEPEAPQTPADAVKPEEPAGPQ